MSSLKSISGILPPVCTPFTVDGEIDARSLERLLRYQLDNGVTGIFALGSTSEAGALSDEERREVLEITVGTVAGRVPVMAGVIDMSTARVLHHASVAADVGVDGLVACGPFYIRPGQEEIKQHFRLLHQQAGLPILAYDVPPNVQTVLAKETVVGLAEEGVIIGIKDSSGNEINFRALIELGRHLEDFSVFTGSELTADYAMFTGASGIVPGLGNVDPAGYRRLYDAAVANDWDTARQEQRRLATLYDIILQATPNRVGFTAGTLGGFKTALRELGIIETNIMATPMPPLNDEESARIRGVLERAGML